MRGVGREARTGRREKGRTDIWGNEVSGMTGRVILTEERKERVKIESRE